MLFPFSEPVFRHNEIIWFDKIIERVEKIDSPAKTHGGKNSFPAVYPVSGHN